MLRHMRHGVFSGLFLAILLLGGVGLVFTDWSGTFRNGVRSTDIASVGHGDIIRAGQFDKTVRSILRMRNIEAQKAYQYGLVTQILESMILERLLNQDAHDQGLIMGKDLLVKKLDDILAPIVKDAGVSRQEALDRLLYAQGISQTELIKQISRESENNLLASSLSKSGDFIPKTLAKDLYRHRKEARTFETLALPHSNITSLEEPSEEELRAHYTALQRTYLVPEKRNFTLAIISPEHIKKTIEITDEDISAHYEEAIDAYTVPEKRTLQQAILKTESQAMIVLQDAEKGMSIRNSVIKETGDEKAYLGEDDFEKSGLLDDIAKAAFETEKGKVAGPVKTPLGYHVLYIKDISEEHVRPLEEVQKTIREELIRERAMDEIIDLSNDIDDRLAMGEELTTVAEEHNLTLHTYTGKEIDDDSSLDAIEDKEDIAYILRTVFELEEGENAPVSELSNGDYYSVHLDDLTPETVKPFEDVREDVLKKWTAHNQKMNNLVKCQTYLEPLNNDEKTLKDIAKDEKVKIKTFKEIGRFDEAPKDLPHGALMQLFAAKKGEYIIVSQDDYVLIGRTTDIHIPDPAKISDKELESFLPSMASEFQQEVVAAYVGYLQKKYGYSINEKLIKQMYDRGDDE